MIFESHSPAGFIQNCIETMLYFKGYTPQHSKERVVPTGHIHLLIELDDIPRHLYDDELNPVQTHQGAWISGMHRRHINIYAPPNSSMFVVRFKHFGAYPFIKQAISLFNDQLVRGELLFGQEILSLRKSLLEKETPSEKFELVEQWLNSTFNPQLVASDELERILEALSISPAAKFANIVQSYPKTQKHLIDQFKKHAGLTPKYLHRILRFNDILNQIKQKERLTWTDIAYQTGFSDQSHFIKEFKHFSGFSPKEFINQDFDDRDTNFFPLDKQG